VRARDEYRGRDVQRDRARQELANRVGASNLDREALRNIDRSQLPQRPGTSDAGGNLRDRAAGVDRGQIQDRAAGVDRGQLQNRAANVDRSQLQNRAPGMDRGQLQNRNANAAAINRDNALRGAGNSAQTRQQIERGTASPGGDAATTRVGCGPRRGGAAAIVMGPTLQRTSARMEWPRIGAGLLLVAALAIAEPAMAQRIFPTPEAAADALVDGLARSDDAGVRVVLGPDYRRLIPVDAATAEDVTDFLAAWA